MTSEGIYGTEALTRAKIEEHFAHPLFEGVPGYTPITSIVAMTMSLFTTGKEEGVEFATRHIENDCGYRSEKGLRDFAHARRMKNKVLYSAIPLYMAEAWSEGFIVGYHKVLDKRYCKECGHELP